MNRFPYDENDKTYSPIAKLDMEAGGIRIFPALTGKPALAQISALMQNFRKNPEKYGNTAFPVDARQQRRITAAAERRQSRKGKRAYVRREWSKEREANQLAQLFNIIDRRVPADPLMRLRAQQGISARIKFLRDAEQAEYDRQIALRQANRDLPAPNPVRSHETIESQLRAIAKAAPIVLPKVSV